MGGKADQAAGLFASFVTFLSNKEKLDISLLFQKDFYKIPSLHKKKAPIFKRIFTKSYRICSNGSNEIPCPFPASPEGLIGLDIHI